MGLHSSVSECSAEKNKKPKVPKLSESDCKYGKRLPAALLLPRFGMMTVHLLDQLLGWGFDGASPNHRLRSCGTGEHLLPSPCLGACDRSANLGKFDHVRGLEGNRRKERAGKGSVYICSGCYLEEENTFISPVDCQLIFLRQALMENNKTHFSQAVSRTLTGQASTQNRPLWNITH